MKFNFFKITVSQIFILFEVIFCCFLIIPQVEAMGIVRGRVKNTKTNTYLPAPGQPTPQIEWCTRDPQGGCLPNHTTPGPQPVCCQPIGGDAASQVLDSSICARGEDICNGASCKNTHFVCYDWRTPPCPSPFYLKGGSGHICSVDRSKFPEYNYNMWIYDQIVDMPFKTNLPLPESTKPYFKFEAGWACDNANTFFQGITNNAYPGIFTQVNFRIPENASGYFNITDLLYTPPDTPTYPSPTPGKCICEKVEVEGEITAGKTIVLTTFAKSLDPEKVKINDMIYHVERNGKEIPPASNPILAEKVGGEKDRYFTKWNYQIPSDGQGIVSYRIWVEIRCGYISSANIVSNNKVMGIETEKLSLLNSFIKKILSKISHDNIKGVSETKINTKDASSLKLGVFYPAANVMKGCHEITFNLKY